MLTWWHGGDQPAGLLNSQIPSGTINNNKIYIHTTIKWYNWLVVIDYLAWQGTDGASHQPAGASNWSPELFNVGARKRIMRNMFTNVRPSRKYNNFCQLLHLREFAYDRIYYIICTHNTVSGLMGMGRYKTRVAMGVILQVSNSLCRSTWGALFNPPKMEMKRHLRQETITSWMPIQTHTGDYDVNWQLHLLTHERV